WLAVGRRANARREGGMSGMLRGAARIALVAVGVVLAHAAPALAVPSLTLSIASGPPTTAFSASGTGFAASQLVDVSWDSTPLATVTAGTTGAFSGLALTVPAGATPGRHAITARQGQSGAQATFVVRTSWATDGFGAAHLGVNPYENVLGPATV